MPLPSPRPSRNGTHHPAPGSLAARLAQHGYTRRSTLPVPGEEEGMPVDPAAEVVSDTAPTPLDPANPASSPAPHTSRDSRVSRAAEGTGVLAGLERYLTGYVVMPPLSALVVAAWVLAAHAADRWDRFPHLAVTSPEKRCGKTLLLRLLELVCPGARHAANVSAASVYRLIGVKRGDGQTLTLLLDEAQSLARPGSEAAQALNELLCAGIDRKAVVLRVGGPKNDQVM